MHNLMLLYFITGELLVKSMHLSNKLKWKLTQLFEPAHVDIILCSIKQYNAGSLFNAK